jgi:hypothetical protein
MIADFIYRGAWKSVRPLMRIASILAVGIISQGCLSAVGRYDPYEIPTVTYCDLVGNPKLYNNKHVRLRAVFSQSFEVCFLGDVVCDPAKTPKIKDVSHLGEIWMELNPYIVTKADTDDTRKELMEYSGLMDLTAVGAFSVATPPHSYGHMGACRFQFTLEHVEKMSTIEKMPYGVR